jgi:wobble nucleotide-excising tRNase
MFIKQFKHVGAIGRLRRCAPEGDVTLKKFTLMFGENGRGKTTLCSILRSLQTNNPAIIVGRRTLGDGQRPNVILNLEGDSARFVDNMWTAPPPRLRIFDAQYVADNIFFGDSIGTEQRRNLCNLILGQAGVELARRYHDLDAEIAAKNGEIREVRNVLTAYVPQAQLDTFLGLDSDPDIDSKIEAKRRELEGLRHIDRLRTQAVPEEIEVPVLPTRLPDILGKTLEDVSRDAESQVRAHLKAHGMEGNEAWLSTGLMHLTDECPFCGQSAKGLDLIEAYQSYFNHSYTTFRRELDGYRRLPTQHYSDDRIELLCAKLQSNANNMDVWKRYVTFMDPATPEAADCRGTIAGFRDGITKLLDAKSASPLEAIQLSPEYTAALERMTGLVEQSKAYNDAIRVVRAHIDAFKRTASSARLQSVTNELRWLEFAKKRHEPEVAAACAQYLGFGQEKEQLERLKAEARAQLNAYSTEVVERYQTSINKYLKRFHAGFAIERVRVEYTGRVPNSTFCIRINDTTVEMGNEDMPLDEPSFKNTLSAGDRSTLALAFFMTELEADREKAECIVVFDDPFNSQDHFRRTRTITEIKRCGDWVAQVIVMSHDRNFLRDLWKLPLPTDNRKALWLIRAGTRDSIIAEWDIESDTESEDAGNRRVLLGYHLHDRGNARDVIQKLRPVLETHMVRMAPHLLGNVRGLGNMLETIREAGTPPILVDLYDDIDAVNVYTRKYMHGEGPNPDGEPVYETELKGFVQQVLEIAGALSDS